MFESVEMIHKFGQTFYDDEDNETQSEKDASSQDDLEKSRPSLVTEVKPHQEMEKPHHAIHPLY